MKKKKELSGDKLKWIVQLDYKENFVLLTQEEYEVYSAEVLKDSPKPFFGIKRTSELISTRPISIKQNPEWRDPKLSKAKEILYRLQKDFLERKENGEVLTWEEYRKEKKDKIKKEMDDFMKEIEK